MEPHLTLIALGALFAAGLFADVIGRRVHVPRVTLLILLGVAAGPLGLDLLPQQLHTVYELLAAVALTMVAFLLGGALSLARIQRHGKKILAISISVVVITALSVSGGLIALGVPVVVALVLAGVATATAPAATLDVIRQFGTKGEFAQTLEGIVAIDDAWGLIAFSLLLIVANVLAGNGAHISVLHGLWEIGGAVMIGVAVGFPAAYLTGRLRPGEPMQAEALAVVFLCAGLSMWLSVSFLLAGIVAGLIVVNFASHHTRAFHEIEHVEWPFMILFFILAGASLHVAAWGEMTATILGFLALRTLARFAGAWIGARLVGAPPEYGRWMGLAMLPQAGVAIGMALVAGDHFPALRDVILSVTIATTVVFEIAGPFATRLALSRTDGGR
jgi:Kef-type K+ transport system membrane component KefB